MKPDELSSQIKAMSILIVDDEQSIHDMLAVTFRRFGFPNLYFAYSGLEALKVLGIDHPQHGSRFDHVLPRHVDLAIVDIMLPDLLGFDVCLAMKNQISPHLPVLLMTGYPIEANHAKFVESGADGFLVKPFKPTELIRQINDLLQLKRVAEQAALLDTTTQPHVKTPGSTAQYSLVGIEVGSYLTTKVISWSGASMILQVTDRRNGRIGVLKMLARHALEFEDVLQRFDLETRIMLKLDHPNVVRVIDHGCFEGCPWYVMEYLEGQNLEALIAEQRPMPMDKVLDIGTQLARAIGYIHQQGVIHRDVKPRNVFLLEDGSLKLGDFGIALQMGDLRVTQEGYSIGTPVYMAPEQFDGSEVSAASDVYSYGATLYHMIGGQPPFTATSAMEMLRKHLTVDPAPLTSVRPNVAPAWDDLIVDRCLAKLPGDRPASMDEVLSELAAIGAG